MIVVILMSVCGTVSTAVLKDSKWAFPRIHLSGSSENLSLRVGLEHFFDWKWELKGPF